MIQFACIPMDHGKISDIDIRITAPLRQYEHFFQKSDDKLKICPKNSWTRIALLNWLVS